MPPGCAGSPAADVSGRVGHRHPRGPDEPVADAVAGLEHLDDGGARRSVGELGLDVHEGLVHVRVELLPRLAQALDAVAAERGLELLGDGRERAGGEVTGLAGHVDVVQDWQQGLDDAADRRVADDLTVAVDALLVVDVLGLQSLQVGEQRRGHGVLLGEGDSLRLTGVCGLGRLAGVAGVAGLVCGVIELVLTTRLGRGARTALVVGVVALARGVAAPGRGAGGVAAGTRRARDGHVGLLAGRAVDLGGGHFASLASSSSTTSASTTSSSPWDAPADSPAGEPSCAPAEPAALAEACSEAYTAWPIAWDLVLRSSTLALMSSALASEPSAMAALRSASDSSTGVLTSAGTLSPDSLRKDSVEKTSCSAWFLTSASSRRLRSSSACASASLTMRSISSLDRAEPPVIVIFCSLPVPWSLAETLTMPLASMSKVTSIFGTPRGAGAMPVSSKVPSDLLCCAISRSPWKTWMRTEGWLSSAVLKISERFVGMAVLRSMSLVNRPPLVSMPSESGVTSMSRTSLRSPLRTPAWSE